MRGDRVIEYAAVMIRDGAVISELTTLVNTPCNIHPVAQRTHGIDASMLAGQPTSEDAWQRFMNFIGQAPLIAHNARFDMNFIKYELGRLGKRLSNKTVCTLRLARRRYPNLSNHRLETVARHVLGEIPDDCRLHRALDDARLVARLWMALEER